MKNCLVPRRCTNIYAENSYMQNPFRLRDAAIVHDELFEKYKNGKQNQNMNTENFANIKHAISANNKFSKFIQICKLRIFFQ